jgi:hypothetical protein
MVAKSLDLAKLIKFAIIKKMDSRLRGNDGEYNNMRFLQKLATQSR